MIAPRRRLETVAQDLFDGGTERLASAIGWNTPDVRGVRRQARRMIRSADVITGALARDGQHEMPS
jgi:hypothetical protein